MKPISVQALSHSYPASAKRPERRSLKEVSFEVEEGQTFGLLGPNGGGKTTLFKILSTFFPADSGRAQVYGLDCAAQARQVRPLLGVVFQNPSLDKKLTVRENMVHQGHLYGVRAKPLAKRIDELLGRYSLADRADDLAGTLSGGLRRRVELAKSLLHKPRLLLLDEPSTGLDPGARQALWEHLAELKKEGSLSVLFTTHLMDEAERCDRLVILDEGAVAAEGAPAALKAEIGGDVIRIETPDAPALQASLRGRFQLEAGIIDGSLRLERPNGHTFIPQLVEAFPGLVTSVSLAKPSLEDVFVHHTGRRFATAQERIA
jgi:ABC-2 type transport system ATP-binding protein